ncbi:UNVERIFIED_CONTAM: hypothetical protein PYX00_010291 [Menopon gallinae]|uniref:SAC3/GANP/THP3 conserved domain-containing protein n=1 Tax=Menopon gallinae TaxID=328185 RepID=A0AAW2HET8_9NEOP
MDSDDVIVVYDDETSENKSSNDANMGDDYLNEGEAYSEDDDYGSEEAVDAPQKNIFERLSKPDAKSFNQNVQQTENVDTGIVNSHLQEIVDIKNQIRELEDILHEKAPNIGEKLKSQDRVEDEGELQSEGYDKFSTNFQKKGIQLRRGVSLKAENKKILGRRNETSLFKRKASKIQSERSEERTASLEKTESKRRLNRNEVSENDAGITFYTPFSKVAQTKKLAEVARTRFEKKTTAEDVTNEDQASIETKLQEIENLPPSVTTSLRKILQMTAHTPEEKYKVLDVRDKLYKIMRDRDASGKTGALVGTCPDMCPEKERLQREFQYQVSMFEMVNYPKNTSLNHNYAVKQYCRSSADQEEPLPHELRPVSVLNMTMSYLLNNVADHCELSDDNLGEWYMFMWDRTRALRKELTQQGVCNVDTVRLVEQCARFHIHCAERLVDQDSSIYDDKINTENLTKCLQTLKYMYKDLAKEDIYCPNEPEFVCYSLLLNLNNTSVFTELSDMAERVMSSQPVRFALDVMAAWETRNYVRFFNLVNRTTYLNCCILRRYFNEMRLYATKTMIRSYCTKNYSPQIPIYRFVDNLSFEGVNECYIFLANCSFSFNQNNDDIMVNFNRLSFRNPETPFLTGRAYVVIEEKKKRPFSEIMAGGELPPKTYEDHIPQNSFSPNGELKLDSLLCKDLMEFVNAPPSSASASSQPPKPKLFESKAESSKPKESESVPLFSNIFCKPQVPQEPKEDESTEKSSVKFAEEKSVFSKMGEKPTNIFGSSIPSFGQNFGGSTNIFGANFKTDTKPSNLFGPKDDNIFSDKGVTNKKPIFGMGSDNILSSSGSLFGNSDAKFSTGSSSLFKNQELGAFKFKVPTPPPPLPQPKTETQKSKEEEREMERLEADREKDAKKEKLEEEEEERLRNILIEAMKKSKEEAQKREWEKKKAEEEEEERKAREEKKRLEELERQEKLRKAELLKIEEMKRLEEENKRKSVAIYKQKVSNQMSSLKKKYVQWKVREFFNKWRLKTWESIENRKMKEYFKEVHVMYPPVCTEEHLNGNPYGLIIPNTLILEKYQNRRTEMFAPKKEETKMTATFSPINTEEIVVKLLEARAKRLFSKVDPFLWKVVFSVPDELECSSWKDIETSVEMNFVDSGWTSGKKKTPLYYREGCHGTFRYKLSIRCLRGDRMYEGGRRNPRAFYGCNAVVFVVAEDSDATLREYRLERVLKSIYRKSQNQGWISEIRKEYLKSLLMEELWAKAQRHVTEIEIVTSTGRTKEELISPLSKCLSIAARKTSPVTPLRVLKLSDFCSTKWFECVWRRIETSLSNYKIVLKDPNFLIECYNSCLDELLKVFLDEETMEFTTVGDEFLEWVPRPVFTPTYASRLSDSFQSLKLPPWPKEIPKSSHQLTYRIHQYCKKVAEDKKKMKELKWLLYHIIRRSLLWKGLDIYCDEDIESILLNFPWTQLFQELSRFLVQELISKIKSGGEDPSVAYMTDKIEEFSYESSFISKFLKKTKSVQKRRMFEEMDSSPRLEHDSVIFAYSAALEREANKRKREELVEENIQDVFELAECKRQLLDDEDQCEQESREKTLKMDVLGLKDNFQTLNDKLDMLKRRMEENARLLEELNGG